MSCLTDKKPSIFCLCSLNVFTEICPYFDLYSWSVGSMHFCHVFVEDKHGCFDVQHCYATLPRDKSRLLLWGENAIRGRYPRARSASFSLSLFVPPQTSRAP